MPLGAKDAADLDEEPGAENADDVDEEADGSEEPPEKRARVDVAAPPSQSWLGASEPIEALLPGILKGIIGHSLQSVLGVEGWAKVGVISWEGWSSLTQELVLLATNEVQTEKLFFEQSQNAVSKSLCAFLRIAADNVHDIPVVTDTVGIKTKASASGMGLCMGRTTACQIRGCCNACLLPEFFLKASHPQGKLSAVLLRVLLCDSICSHTMTQGCARCRGTVSWRSICMDLILLGYFCATLQKSS